MSGMMWAAIAQVGLNILAGREQYKLAKAQYKAQKTIDDANFEASETIRKASNELGRAQGGLKNWITSVSNQRMIEAAGSEYNALGENIGRHLDQMATGSLQRRVQASEQLGALTAQAAAAGVGGATTDLINGTLRLRNLMVNHEIEKQQGQATYDMLAQRAGILSNAYDSWDYSMVLDSANLMADTKPIRMAPSGTTYLLNALSGASQLNWGEMFSAIGDRGGGSSPQIVNGISSTGNPGTTTPSGYTFFGLRPGGSLRIQ